MRIPTLILSASLLLLPVITHAAEIGTALAPVTFAELPEGAYIIAQIRCGIGPWQAYGEFGLDGLLIPNTVFYECTEDAGTDTAGAFPYYFTAPRS